VVICIIGVGVSALICLLGNSNSFSYNDEHELEGEEKELLKDTSTQSNSIHSVE
jgi:hypothetical protein